MPGFTSRSRSCRSSAVSSRCYIMRVFCAPCFHFSAASLVPDCYRIDDIEDNSQLRRGRPGTSLRSTPPFQDSFLVKLRTRFMVSHRPSTPLTMFTSWPFKKSSLLKRKDTRPTIPQRDYTLKATWTKL